MVGQVEKRDAGKRKAEQSERKRIWPGIDQGSNVINGRGSSEVSLKMPEAVSGVRFIWTLGRGSAWTALPEEVRRDNELYVHPGAQKRYTQARLGVDKLGRGLNDSARNG